MNAEEHFDRVELYCMELRFVGDYAPIRPSVDTQQERAKTNRNQDSINGIVMNQ